jgi:hypothetical protein
MGTGIDEVDGLVEDGKSVVADVRMKWKMKLWGAAVAGVGALITRYWDNPPVMIKVGIGVIVVGVLMILGSDGVKFVLKQTYSAGKNRP